MRMLFAILLPCRQLDGSNSASCVLTQKPPIAACSFCCTSLYRTAGCVTAVLNRRNATAGILHCSLLILFENMPSFACGLLCFLGHSRRSFGFRGQWLAYIFPRSSSLRPPLLGHAKAYGLLSVPGICQILDGLPFFLGHAKCLLSGLCFC